MSPNSFWHDLDVDSPLLAAQAFATFVIAAIAVAVRPDPASFPADALWLPPGRSKLRRAQPAQRRQ
jgi:hypothetical protein